MKWYQVNVTYPNIRRSREWWKYNAGIWYTVILLHSPLLLAALLRSAIRHVLVVHGVIDTWQHIWCASVMDAISCTCLSCLFKPWCFLFCLLSDVCRVNPCSATWFILHQRRKTRCCQKEMALYVLSSDYQFPLTDARYLSGKSIHMREIRRI